MCTIPTDINHTPSRRAGVQEIRAKFLVRAGQFQPRKAAIIVGRNIVLEFPDYASALACYESPEYQRLMAIRAPHGVADIIIIEGYDGPQP